MQQLMLKSALSQTSLGMLSQGFGQSGGHNAAVQASQMPSFQGSALLDQYSHNGRTETANSFAPISPYGATTVIQNTGDLSPFSTVSAR